eukprot:TRINITY_DN15679_c0_g1_i1.p1 TRINITY_DN15679_c0_g1~~TRINITY_DN15679_c0_g1_i1.p1  ORF type:complete len:1094 (-),score=158.59 TRINITY_DN15679_c0_g1_i1:516-3737(-)
MEGSPEDFDPEDLLGGPEAEGTGNDVGDGVPQDASEIPVDRFEELRLDPAVVADAQGALHALVSSAASKEAAAEAVYSALFEASPAMQSLFVTPRAIAGMKFLTGISNFVKGMSDPPSLKDQVETLAFGHLALEINTSRVVLFRDALLDLFQMELGSKLTASGYEGLKALLNYVGGAIIYIKVYYNARIILLGESWAKGNDTKANKEKFATMGSMEVKPGQEASDAGAGTAAEESKGNESRSDSVMQHVPTTFREMYQFNAAVMGFGQHLWMNEVLACFEHLVLNVANPSRLNEECDFIVCRIAKVSSGKVNLAEFKSGMLASLRSLLPKDWTTEHEIAWSWLWDLCERAISQSLGMPPKWERAYAQFLENLDEHTGYQLRRDIYLRFFALAPAGQDFFKQSNAYLHLVSTKVLTMVVDLYREPVRMVDDISAVGLRHVGYGVSTDFFGPFASSAVEVIATVTTDQACIEGFSWSIGLIAKSTVRTIIEGSTIVMKAINTNTKKSMKSALSNASRGERFAWMLLIQVGSQNISPLAWAIESGALESAAVMIQDLFTIRADRDRYYYANDETFNRHPDLVRMLLTDAPGLLPILLDGLVWRSRMTANGTRRVNFYMKHLLVDQDGKFAKNLEWVTRANDPKLICHPVLVLLSDLVWSRVASTTFMRRKSWFLVTLVAFVISQSVLSGIDKGEGERIVTFILRSFTYVFSLGGMIFAHTVRIWKAYSTADTLVLFDRIPVPSYLVNWQEVANVVLMVLLVVLLATEPILHCWKHNSGELFTDGCLEVEVLVVFNSQISMFAVFIYYALLSDLAVFNNRVSAYVLVCGRMLAELALYLLAVGFVLLMFSSGLSCSAGSVDRFAFVLEGFLALWELLLGIASDSDIEEIRSETVIVLGSFVFLIVCVVFLTNLLIAQLTCAYGAIYSDMVGFARIKRVRIITEQLPHVPKARWDYFVGVLAFEKKIDFNEGDVGVNNGYATTEPASANPTTVEAIRRFGGSTSPDIQWPEEDKGDDDADRWERLELLLKRAMERIIKSNVSRSGKGKPCPSGSGEISTVEQTLSAESVLGTDEESSV